MSRLSAAFSIYYKEFMKVLIIALPRTGSTALMKALGSILNLKTVNEPYYEHNPNLQTYPLKEKDSFIEKSMLNHLPSNIKESNIHFFSRYSKEFDKTILLGRRDLDAMTESFMYALNTNGIWAKGWHDTYVIKDSFKLEEFKQHRKKVEKWMSNIKKLSEISSIPITWYEDLYSGDKDLVLNLIKSWKLPLDYNYLKVFIDPVKKYRKSNTLV